MGIYSGRNRDAQIETSDEQGHSPAKQYSLVPSRMPNELVPDQQTVLGGVIQGRDYNLQDYEDSKSPDRAESYPIK